MSQTRARQVAVSARPAPARRSITSKSWALLLAPALLAGCAGLRWGESPPAPPAPQVQAPLRWQAPAPSQAAAAAAAAGVAPGPAPQSFALDSNWWAAFQDPLLTDLMAAALVVSPDLAEAAARVEQARAARVAAQGAGTPKAGLGIESSVSRQGTASTQLSAVAGVQAAWEMDLFGGLAAGERAAKALWLAERGGWQALRLSVAAETATLYTELRSCQAQGQQAGLDAQSRSETARLTELTAKAGLAAPADAALARAGAAQSRSNAVSTQAQCEVLLKTLVALTGLEEPGLRQRLAAAGMSMQAAEPLAATALLPKAPPLAVDSLPAALLSQRPDLAAAEQRLLAAAADVQQQGTAAKPSLRLQGNLGLFGLRSGLGSGSSSSGLSWSIGPVTLSLPLMDGGSIAANLEAARARYDSSVVVYQAALRQAVREVEIQLVGLQSTALRQADAEQAARDLAISLKATASRQRGGLASQFELESARRDAFAAQSALISLHKERVLSWINLYRALGGGWSVQQWQAGDGAEAAERAALAASARRPFALP